MGTHRNRAGGWHRGWLLEEAGPAAARTASTTGAKGQNGEPNREGGPFHRPPEETDLRAGDRGDGDYPGGRPEERAGVRTLLRPTGNQRVAGRRETRQRPE